MNCDTVSAGFHFWMGKALAELALFGITIGVLALLAGVLWLIYRSKR